MRGDGTDLAIALRDRLPDVPEPGALGLRPRHYAVSGEPGLHAGDEERL